MNGNMTSVTAVFFLLLFAPFSGCLDNSMDPNTPHNDFRSEVKIITDKPVYNATFEIPVSHDSRTIIIDNLTLYKSITNIPFQEKTGKNAPLDDNIIRYIPLDIPAGYSHSFEKRDNGTYLIVKMVELFPETPFRLYYGHSYECEHFLRYYEHHNHPSVGNESLIEPKYRINVEGTIRSAGNLVYVDKEYFYDTEIFADYETDENTTLTIDTVVWSRNDWYHDYDYRPYNSFSDRYSLVISGPSHQWNVAQGALSLDGGYLSAVKIPNS